MRLQVYYFFFLLLVAGCAGQRSIYPLVPGEQSVGVDLGGPLVLIQESTLPLPLSTIYWSRGLKGASEFRLGVHPTAILYGTYYADIGLQKSLILSYGFWPGVNASIHINAMTQSDLTEFRYYPQSDITCWWSDRRRLKLFYLGITHWFDPYIHEVQNRPSYHLWRPALWVGGQYHQQSWDFSLEIKWLAPGEENRFSTVKYTGLNEQGALGISFSTQYRF